MITTEVFRLKAARRTLVASVYQDATDTLITIHDVERDALITMDRRVYDLIVQAVAEELEASQ